MAKLKECEKVVENCIWAVTNLCIGDRVIQKHIITELKLPKILSVTLNKFPAASVNLIRLIEIFLGTIKDTFEKSMLPEFVDLINSIGKFLYDYYFT